MVRKYFFSRNQRTETPKSNSSTTIQSNFGSIAQNLQQILQVQVAQPNRLQIRCAIREGMLLILVEHLLHVEPDPQETFKVLEQSVGELVPELLASDPDCNPTDRAQALPVRLYLRVAGYQQPYALHSLTVNPIAPVSPSPIPPNGRVEDAVVVNPVIENVPIAAPVTATPVITTPTSVDESIAEVTGVNEPTVEEPIAPEPIAQEPIESEPFVEPVDNLVAPEAEETVQTDAISLDQPDYSGQPDEHYQHTNQFDGLHHDVNDQESNQLDERQEVNYQDLVDQDSSDQDSSDQDSSDQDSSDQDSSDQDSSDQNLDQHDAIDQTLFQTDASGIIESISLEETIDITALTPRETPTFVSLEPSVDPIAETRDSDTFSNAGFDTSTVAQFSDELESRDRALVDQPVAVELIDDAELTETLGDQSPDQSPEIADVESIEAFPEFADPEIVELSPEQSPERLPEIEEMPGLGVADFAVSTNDELDNVSVESAVEPIVEPVVEPVDIDRNQIDNNQIESGTVDWVSTDTHHEQIDTDAEIWEEPGDRAIIEKSFEPISEPNSLDDIDSRVETTEYSSEPISDDIEATDIQTELDASIEPIETGDPHLSELEPTSFTDVTEFTESTQDISTPSVEHGISDESIGFTDNSIAPEFIVDYPEYESEAIAIDPLASNTDTFVSDIHPIESESITDNRTINEQFTNQNGVAEFEHSTNEQFTHESPLGEQFINEQPTDEQSIDELSLDEPTVGEFEPDESGFNQSELGELDIYQSDLAQADPNEPDSNTDSNKLASTELQDELSSESVENSNTAISEPVIEPIIEPIADPWHDDNHEASSEQSDNNISSHPVSEREVVRDRLPILENHSSHDRVETSNAPQQNTQVHPTRVIPSAKSTTSSFDHLPLDVDTLPKRSRRSSITLLGAMITGSVGLFILLSGAYVLTRPCVLGNTCEPLQSAQDLSQKALGIVQSNPSALEVVDAHDQLTKANQLLDTIPPWSKYRADAQNLLSQYQEQLEELNLIVQALNQANTAAKKSSNPPHPIQIWREVQWIWREAIDVLDQVPADSLVYTLAQNKRAEYQSNLDGINHRIVVEQESQERIDAIKEAATVIDARSRIVNSVETWQQASESWQTVIDNLRQIPHGTMAHAEAARLITTYQLKLEDSERRRTREEQSVSAYNEALNLADQARRLEQQEQWSQAVIYWRDALTTLKQISEGTTRYSQARTLLEPYTTSLNRAETNLKQTTLLQTLKPQLDRACSGTPQPCSYTVAIESIRIQLTPTYDQVVQQAFLAAQSGGSSNVRADITNQVNQFLRSLASIGETAQVPIELYNSGGSKFGTYDPTRSGYIAQ